MSAAGAAAHELELQLRGYRLATAEIVYHLPDHPGLLQSFVWQQYDLAPEFPRFRRFVAWWQEHLDGKIHSVRISCAGRIMAPSWQRGFVFDLQ